MTFQDYTLFFLFTPVFLFQVKKFVIDQKISFCISWIIRLSFCGFVACALHVLEITNMPVAILMMIVLISIFIYESFRAWYLISQFTKLELPLFPRFQYKSNTIIWPQEDSFESLRLFLKAKNFKTICGLTTLSTGSEICLLSSVFQNKEDNIRVQIIFSPIRFGKNIVNTIVTSYMQDGEKLITHNINMPFGCLIENNKLIKRFPLKSAKDVITTHIKRVQTFSANLSKIDSETTVDSINDDIKELEQICVDKGFCHKAERSSMLCLSQEGAYLLWKSILKISYLGRA